MPFAGRNHFFDAKTTLSINFYDKMLKKAKNNNKFISFFNQKGRMLEEESDPDPSKHRLPCKYQ